MKFENATETSSIILELENESYQKIGFAIMEPLARSWLAFARSYMAIVSLPRSWQDLGKASKELVMDLGKDTMVSNIG